MPELKTLEEHCKYVEGFARVSFFFARKWLVPKFPEKKPGDWFRKGEKLGEIRDYFGRSLLTEYAPEDGVLLYQCASLNIIAGGPMLSYGVPGQLP